jgi:creatinine amidohydrolase/Fe(II)-dependent formamide hydrolase-like protein
MYHVKYCDFFGRLVLCPGRSARADAASEAEDYAHAGHREVEVLVDLATADANMGRAAARPRRHPLPGAAGDGRRDDGQPPPEAPPLR